ncbi:MAG TPA: response regulator [Myxococcales bacterium]|nr:response regulator [Myxococcales bacterium]
MPPAETRDLLARWRDSTRLTALALISSGNVQESNARFEALEAGGVPWRWLNGPHARVRYDSLSELIRIEAATLAPAPYLSRFQRANQVVEVRLERLAGGEALALIHDVTAEVGRQRELQRDREALLHEERMHAMGVLASGVAHDLNHMLNVIALRVATLRADPQLGRSRRTLDVLARVVGEAARVVARLQDLARRRRDRPSDPLDLAAVLTGAVEMARTEADTASVRIEVDVPPLPLVRGSAAELAHVFGSLLLHAREQMPDGGTIQVKAREDRGRALVTIRDSGPGMYEEDLARLFDPFSGVAGESALGLSVAWGVMSRLGGSLQAQSRRGQGTTFTLAFPLAAPPRREPPRPVPVKPPTRRILIVDDEQDNLEVLREVLELENQDVDVARGGPEALALLERGQCYDLVLCDVGMPEMSGWQVAREIQRVAEGTPVWMLTGWANEIGESDPRRRYVRGVLAKPLDLEQLRSLLGSSPKPTAPQPNASGMH